MLGPALRPVVAVGSKPLLMVPISAGSAGGFSVAPSLWQDANSDHTETGLMRELEFPRQTRAWG